MISSRLNLIRYQLMVVVILLSAGLATSLTFTLYELNLRKHDYLILNLTGQLRATTRVMAEQADRYQLQAPDSYAKYDRDLNLYWRDLRQQSNLAGEIVTALKTRQLTPKLTGRDTAITCTWDQQSKHQMELTAEDWSGFKQGLDRALGDDSSQPRLTWAAQYIAKHGPYMARSADRLALAFQNMMEGKLDQIRLFQTITGVFTILALLMVAMAAHRRILRPLKETVSGFGRVAQGDLAYRVPVLASNEIGQMTLAFNSLTERMQALFHLTDRINQGRRLDEMLDFVLHEFRVFLPVDWVGVFFAEASSGGQCLERMAGTVTDLNEGEIFTTATTENMIALRLAGGGLVSSLAIPLAGGGTMVFAAQTAHAYTPQHREFLANIASQIGHILDKTLATEGLVVAAVEGLAKLAESRDPETGDHLVRMALYSAIVAEELGRDGPYREAINPAYVREVWRFAPMHDIGKVGIADSILLKPGRLDTEERKEMERHPVIGGEVLRRCEAQMKALGHSIFAIGIEIAECHHEKFDGSGYPAGLSGQAVPLSARIVAVADVFDALTSKRPYKEAWPVEKALSVLDEECGQHFDPEVVSAFHRALPRVLDVYARTKHV